MNGDIDITFLSKLQQVLNTLDEMDNMIKDNPDNQQKIDYEISDYLHLIQNTDLDKLDINKVMAALKKLRLKRASHYRFYEIAKTYNANRDKLKYTSSRANLKEIIKNTLDNLNNEYNYRILESDDLNTLCTEKIEEKKKRSPKKSKYRITEFDLRKMVDEGMSTSEIATIFGCNQSMISHYKRKYGISTRSYKRKD